MTRKRWRVSIDSPEETSLFTHYITTYDLEQYMKEKGIKVDEDSRSNENYLSSCVLERYENKSCAERIAGITIEEVTS